MRLRCKALKSGVMVVIFLSLLMVCLVQHSDTYLENASNNRQLKVSAFNIENLGLTKMGKPEVVRRLVQVSNIDKTQSIIIKRCNARSRWFRCESRTGKKIQTHKIYHSLFFGSAFCGIITDKFGPKMKVHKRLSRVLPSKWYKRITWWYWWRSHYMEKRVPHSHKGPPMRSFDSFCAVELNELAGEQHSISNLRRPSTHVTSL